MALETEALQHRVRREGLDYGQFERVREAWAWFREHVPAPARIRVVGDDDSDGINSAFTVSIALRRAGYEADPTVMPVHSETDADRALQGGADAFVIADSGSNVLSHLDRTGVPVLVLDHHRVHDYQPRNVFEVNPRRLGGDAVRHCSASILSLLFAAAADARNWDLAYSGLAGAISDRQHLGGLLGLVGFCVDGGVSAGVITRNEGLTLVGSTMQEAIAESLDPFFEGLSGDPRAAQSFLEAQTVPPGTNPLLVAPAAGRRVADALEARLRERRVVADRIYPLYAERLLLRHASGVPTVFALAQLLEAATAANEPEQALRLLAGSPEARQTLQALYKRRLANLFGELRRVRAAVQDATNLRWAETGDDADTGVYAHALLTFVLGDDKPFVIMSRRGGLAKFSARGSPRLFTAGVDLSIGLMDAAQAVGGHGGGHPGAAGATVPWARREEFLALLDRRLAELRRRGPA